MAKRWNFSCNISGTENEFQWCLTSSRKTCVRLMSAIASCFVNPEDNIAHFLLTNVDIAFETHSDVLSRG